MSGRAHVMQEKSAPPSSVEQRGLLQRQCACGTHAGGSGACEECTKRKLGLQRKLTIGSTGDPLELEADRVADQVMKATSHSAISHVVPRISRHSPHSTGFEMESAFPSVEDVLASPGRSLEPTLRKEMEQSFSHDFSTVRVHTGAAAEQSARDVNAHAYTVGHNVVFGAGRYAPGSQSGKRLLAHELVHVVQQSHGEGFRRGPTGERRGPNDALACSASGAIQRQIASKSNANPQGNKKQSRIVRVERYWHSTSARVFLEDGSNEEVTFIDGSRLDTPSAPERRYEKVVDLVIDHSSPIRPHLEIAPHGTGSSAKVETRLAPSDRIARLPANVQQQLSEAFQTGTGDEPDPQTMEFIADMGDRLHGSSTTMDIQLVGRDPATLSRMKTVDQWVAGQKDALSKVAAWRRGKFAQLLSDIRRIGVTGPSASEDLDAQDIELVLAGVAGGQSDFQTFAEFKRIFEWKLRDRSASLSQDAANNPEFFIRNEYRRAWQAEAAGLRKLSRTAEAAQLAPFKALGWSALIGTGAFGLEAVGTGALDLAASRGISTTLFNKWVGASLLGASGLGHLIGAGKEAKAAGMDPTAPANMVNIVSTAALRTLGLGEIEENITNKSMLTQQDLGRSPLDRGIGGTLGALNAFGTLSMFVPEAPNVENASPSPRQAGKSGVSGPALADESKGASLDTSAEAASPIAAVAEEKIGELGPMTEETRQMLRNPKNQELLDALDENRLAADVLKLCKSPCLPEFATPAQIRRLNRVLEEAQRNNFKINSDSIREFLHQQHDAASLDSAITTVEEQLSRQLPARPPRTATIDSSEESLSGSAKRLKSEGVVGDAPAARPGVEKKYPLGTAVGLPGYVRFHVEGIKAIGDELNVVYAPERFNISETAVIENQIRQWREEVGATGGELNYEITADTHVHSVFEGVTIKVLDRITWKLERRLPGTNKFEVIFEHTARP